MKYWKVLSLLAILAIGFASCSPSPYKKRKPCRGKGNWYNNRNLDGRG